MNIETIYKGHSNTINLILKSNNSAVDLAGVNKMTLTFKGAILISTNSTVSISWSQAGYATGETRLHLGAQATLSTGIYEAPLVVYETTDAEGVVWGDVAIRVREEVEGS
jgi:hypothetical protein